MPGYWNDTERTAEAIDADGWMHTGDLATMDDEGYVNIVGRSKDMVIRGGENVYPREVEEFLYSHPAIADVQVIGVPDTRYGEELMAWIIPRGDASLDADAVREFCQGRIAHYKIPRYVKLVDAFPMTVTGKVQKFKMRDQPSTGWAWPNPRRSARRERRGGWTGAVGPGRLRGRGGRGADHRPGRRRHPELALGADGGGGRAGGVGGAHRGARAGHHGAADRGPAGGGGRAAAHLRAAVAAQGHPAGHRTEGTA
jgi:hypothetical protein